MPWPVTTRDLASGDTKSATLDLTPFDLSLIRSAEHPLFDEAYTRLWNEFGPTHGMEQRDVIEQRFHAGRRFWYEMAFVRKNREFMAVRDHTAALTRHAIGNRLPPQVLVHLSHILIAPAGRRTGLAGWLRALPLAAARQCLLMNEASSNVPVTLLAEMEHAQKDEPERMIRLLAYERAGFKKIDSQMVEYFQPDFRPPAEIDASGGPQPLPFQLIVRRAHREDEDSISAAEVHQLVETLYDIYSLQLRPADMALVTRSLERYPPPDARIPLVPPTQC